MSVREERAVHTAPGVTSQDLCHMARLSSAPFMATCPGENINYYLYGYLNLRERQEKTPRLGALSPEGLGATGGARGAAESLRKIRKAVRAPCDPCLPALTLFGVNYPPSTNTGSQWRGRGDPEDSETSPNAQGGLRRLFLPGQTLSESRRKGARHQVTRWWQRERDM